MRLAHHAQVVPYILIRMLRVTSVDEVLLHAARKSHSKPGILGGLAHWMAVALTRPARGRPQILGGVRRQGEMTDHGMPDSQRRADGMVRNAPTNCSECTYTYTSSLLIARRFPASFSTGESGRTCDPRARPCRKHGRRGTRPSLHPILLHEWLSSNS